MMLSALAAFVTQAGAFVIAGPFMTSLDLGLARGAERLALLVSFPLTAVNAFIAPRIVAHATQKNAEALRSLMLKACIASTLPSVPIALGLIVLPEVALGFFGSEFHRASEALRILAVTQLITAVTAPFAQLLYLNGSERTLTYILIASMALAAILLPIGSASFGLAGFAWAYLLINAAKNGLIVRHAVRTL